MIWCISIAQKKDSNSINVPVLDLPSQHSRIMVIGVATKNIIYINIYYNNHNYTHIRRHRIISSSIINQNIQHQYQNCMQMYDDHLNNLNEDMFFRWDMGYLHSKLC